MEASQGTEIKILSVIRVKKNWFKYKPILQASFFSSEETRQLFGIIEGFFQKYENEKLTTGNMRLLVGKNIKDEDLRRSCYKVIKTIRNHNSEDSNVVEEVIKAFTKNQLIKLAINDSISLLDQANPDLTTIRDYFERASNLSIDGKDDLYHYFENPSKRLQDEIHEKRIPSGIKKLDLELEGGMSPGELLVFLAPPGRGKTITLINVGVGALSQGLKVCHITLEISARKIARRYDMRITKKTFTSLREHPEKMNFSLDRLKKNGCELIIRDYSMESPRVEDLYTMIINYQNRYNKKFDMVIVDYGDLLNASQKHKDTRFALEEIYTDLRRLSVKLQVPVYTASQTNRESLSKHVVGMKDVAESFGKVKVADVVVGICQTPEEEEEKLVRLFIAKSRKRSGHPSIRLEMDPDRMYIGEYQDGLKD